MGYLTHNPLYKRMMGADHFVLAYRFEKDGVLIHDPEGFPSILLPFRQLELAWRADSIPYRRGYYRYWTRPRRARSSRPDELYDSSLRSFKEVYSEAESLAAKHDLTIDAKAITTLQKHVEQGRVSPAERGFMVYFSFKLGARRALDFASFFRSKHPELAALKQKQAELFGALQSSAVQRKWTHVAEALEQLARVETEFRDALLAS
jgi:hypothetical protein